MSTSPSAVHAKRSAQGEDSEEEEDEVTAGSAAKRRREASHMTSHMTGEAFGTGPLIECCTRRSYSVMQNCFSL